MNTQNPLKLTIETDPATKTLHVGQWSTQEIHYNTTRSEHNLALKIQILNANGLDTDEINIHGMDCCPDLKKNHSFVVRHLGGRFYARLRAVSRQLWITPIEQYLNRYCLNFYGRDSPYFNLEQTRRVWGCLATVKQVYEDELHHIGPLVIFFMLNPKELKARLGKSLWKRLCSNKLSFNLRLVRTLMGFDGEHRRVKPLDEETFERLIPLLDVLTQVKKGLTTHQAPIWNFDARYFHMRGFEVDEMSLKVKLLNWLNIHCKVTHTKEIKEHITLFRDSLMMHYRLGEGRTFKFLNPIKLREYHDALSKKITIKRRNESLKRKQAMNNNMQWLTPYSDGFSQYAEKTSSVAVKTLNTVELIIDESDSMEHCITCYIDNICDQQYIAISLRCSSARSTLGFTLNKKRSKYKLDQHVGKYNEAVTEPLLINMQKPLLKLINQQLKLSSPHQ